MTSERILRTSTPTEIARSTGLRPTVPKPYVGVLMVNPSAQYSLNAWPLLFLREMVSESGEVYLLGSETLSDDPET